MKRVAYVALCMFVPSLVLAETEGNPPPQPGHGSASPQPGYGYPPPQTGYAYPPPGYGYPPPPGYGYPPPGYGYPPPPPPTNNLTGLTLVAGLGFGKPWGDVAKSSNSTSDMSIGSLISDQIPLSIGAGYRPIPVFSFGVALQYAPLVVKNCDGGTCSATDLRIGGELRFHVIPEQMLSPWMSVGVGYEWMNLSVANPVMSLDLTYSGWDFEIQVGGDIRATPFLTIGPYLSMRVGTFSHLRVSGGSSADQDIPDANQVTHGWWSFGVRGAFTLFPN